jgi:hypothetical protein
MGKVEEGRKEVEGRKVRDGTAGPKEGRERGRKGR